MNDKFAGCIGVACRKSEIYWEIYNFSTECCSGMDVGDALFSPDFTTECANGYIEKAASGHHRRLRRKIRRKNEDIVWHLSLYPKGRDDSHKEYLSLYVHCKTKIRATATVTFFNNKGEVVISKTFQEDTFDEYGWGYSFLRSFILNPTNGVLHNDKLTIGCKIKCTSSEIESLTIKSYCEAKKQKIKTDVSIPLGENYEALFNDKRFTDVSLVSEGKSIKSHKCILARKSAVFAAMFSTEMQESNIKISDIKYDVLTEMLRFIYIRKVKNIDSLASELVVAADKYALNDLKFACQKRMRTNLSVDNVIQYLGIADKLQLDSLKEDAIEFIVKNAKDISNKPEFMLLPRNVVCEVFRCLANKSD